MYSRQKIIICVTEEVKQTEFAEDHILYCSEIQFSDRVAVLDTGLFLYCCFVFLDWALGYTCVFH